MMTPREVGLHNRAIIRRMLLQYPGISQREIATAIGLTACAVGRHVAKIRAAWLEGFPQREGAPRAIAVVVGGESGPNARPMHADAVKCPAFHPKDKSYEHGN